jgi:hypothetical protein
MWTAPCPPLPIEAGSQVNRYATCALNTAPTFNRGFDPEGWTPTLMHAEGWFEFENAQGLQVLISVDGRRLFHVPAA